MWRSVGMSMASGVGWSGRSVLGRLVDQMCRMTANGVSQVRFYCMVDIACRLGCWVSTREPDEKQYNFSSGLLDVRMMFKEDLSLIGHEVLASTTWDRLRYFSLNSWRCMVLKIHLWWVAHGINGAHLLQTKSKKKLLAAMPMDITSAVWDSPNDITDEWAEDRNPTVNLSFVSYFSL